ncbi:hypothetical protein M9H77_27838 [Catharanthus roseus]|uniref:Uncharacterized protein n=1 Tax=Catharanthus roseus TaxID=4058 RepID=A0ACC0AFI5_CATRO|nr:hypothetical protein M9H77_27838 [Catharanthus roseus]
MSRPHVCKNCGNPLGVVWFANFDFQRTVSENGLGEVVFCRPLIKKNADYRKYYRNAGSLNFADIHCANSHCKLHIGYNFISGPDSFLKKGDVLLIRENIQEGPDISGKVEEEDNDNNPSEELVTKFNQDQLGQMLGQQQQQEELMNRCADQSQQSEMVEQEDLRRRIIRGGGIERSKNQDQTDDMK